MAQKKAPCGLADALLIIIKYSNGIYLITLCNIEYRYYYITQEAYQVEAK
jgi:hypothetical protein